MISLIFLIAFPFLLWNGIKNIRLARESVNWPSVMGTITESKRGKVLFRSVPRVTYAYQVDGRDYSGNSILVGGVPQPKLTETTLARYPQGTSIPVFYSPQAPSISALQPGPNPSAGALLRTYIFCFVIILLSNAGLYFVNRLTANNEPHVRTYDDEAASDPGTGDRLIREAADKGDAKDESYVGTWYLGGLEGYPKDPAEAAKWFEKAADQGDAGSQTLLGELYAKGEGVPKDYAKSMAWIQKGAAQGDANAYALLGEAYEKGVPSANIAKDTNAAIEWYRKAGDKPAAKAGLARLGAQ